MDVASLIVRIGADVSSLEAGLSRANALVEANAGKMKQAGAAAAESGTAATAAQDRFNAALARTQAQLQALKGESLGSLKTSFPSVSDADLSKMAALKGEIEGVKKQFAEQGLAAREAEKVISAAGKEAAASVRMQATALKEAEAEWGRFAATAEKSSLSVNRKLATAATADAKKAGLGATLSSPGVQKLGDAALGAAAVGGFGLYEVGKTAIEFEKNFASVAKAVDGSKPQLAALKQQLEDLSKRIPVKFDDLAKIAAIAAEAGVGRENLAKYTETIAKLQATVRVGGDELTMGFAKIANVMKEPAGNVDRMGATLIGLGNAFAATEPEIIDFAQRLSGVAPVIGMSTRELMAFGAAMASSAIPAERGGTALSRLFQEMFRAVQSGGPKLRELAAVAGLLPEKFQALFKSDPGRAFLAFEEGLNRLQKAHVNIFPLMDQMGIKNVRVTETVLKMANAHGLLKAALDNGDKSWNENTILNEKFATKTDTTASKLQLFQNQLGITAEKLGQHLLPALNKTLDKAQPFLEFFEHMSAPAQQAAVNITLVGTAVSLLFGGLTKAVPLLAGLGAGMKGLGGLFGGGAGAAGAAGGAGAGFELPAVAAAGGGGLLARLGSLVTGGALSGLTPKVDVTGDIIRNLGLDKRFPGLFGDYGQSSDIRATKEVSAAQLQAAGVGGGSAGPAKRLGTASKPGGGEDVGETFRATSKDAQKFADVSETLSARLFDLKEKLAGNEMSLAALHKRYPDVSEAALKLYRAHELEAQGIEKTMKLREKHSAALAKEKEHYKEAVDAALAKLRDTKGGGDEESSAQKIAKQFPHASAAQRDYLQNIGEETKKQKEVADARKKAESELKTLTNEVEASRGKLVQQQAIAAAGGRVWDVHALALEKTHRAYEGLGPPMRQAIDDLAALGRQTQAAELLAKSTQEIEKAKAGLQALRTGDAAGLLRAEHLGVDDATIGKLSAYQQQLLGIKNATEAIKARTSPIIDPATKNALEALKRYAGTGNAEAYNAKYEASELNRAAGILNRMGAPSSDLGGRSQARYDLDREEYMKRALGPELLGKLQNATGDAGAFFGGRKSQEAMGAQAQANQVSAQAAQAFLQATTDFKKGLEFSVKVLDDNSTSTFRVFGDGLKGNVQHFDQVIDAIGQTAVDMLQEGKRQLQVLTRDYGQLGISGGRAMGGPVSGGSAYMVGERGPEIFTPGASGNITPNSALGGGDTHVHVNMVVHAADAASFHRSQGQMMQNLGRAVERHMGRNG